MYRLSVHISNAPFTMGNLFTTFTNCRLCINGKIVDGERLVVSQDTGQILKSTGYIGGDIIDLDGDIIAPGYLDLNAFGRQKPPTSSSTGKQEHDVWLQELSEKYVFEGVVGFWTTTSNASPVSSNHANASRSAKLLGNHVASTSSIAMDPDRVAATATSDLATLDVTDIDSITTISSTGVRVAVSSNSATYAQAESALYAGATCLCPPFAPITSDDPGALGLLALQDRLSPFVVLPCDVEILHAKTAVLLFRSSPEKAILSSSPAIALDQAVRNMYYWSGCDIAKAVKAVTENVADLMGLRDRGRLREGYRADFVVLDDGGNVKQVWLAGVRLWPEDNEADDEEYF